MENNEKLSGESQLFDKAFKIIGEARGKVIQSIYKESTESYFKLGEIIVEQEQAGEGRADYGSKLITSLSKKLTAKFGRGYSSTTLKDARQFYNVYQKSRPVAGELNFELSFSHYNQL